MFARPFLASVVPRGEVIPRVLESFRPSPSYPEVRSFQQVLDSSILIIISVQEILFSRLYCLGHSSLKGATKTSNASLQFPKPRAICHSAESDPNDAIEAEEEE